MIPKKNKYQRSLSHPCSWMRALNEKLTLKDICLPATHLSGMYKVLNKEGSVLTSDCHQQLNIYDQLNHGVRYFDFRPQFIATAERNRVKNLDSFHVYYENIIGPSLEEILGDIRAFFSNDTLVGQEDTLRSETIILYFSHFKDFNKEGTQWFFSLLKERIGHWLLDKKKLGQKKINQIPLIHLRNKIIVVIKNSGTGSMKLPLFGRGDFFWDDEDFPVVNESVQQSSIEEVKQQQIRRFIRFDQTEQLFMLNWRLVSLTSKKDVEVVRKLNQEIFNVEEKFNNNPLLWVNGKHQKVNIISVDLLQSNEVLLACQRVNKLQGRESGYGHNPQSNASYLIRSYTHVDQCLTMEEEMIEQPFYNCFLKSCWSCQEASFSQIFTFYDKSFFQRNFVMTAERLPSRPILTTKGKTTEICGASVPDALIDFHWSIEPYFLPIRNDKGVIVEYQRQKACFLIYHALKKQCLAIAQETSKLILLPYDKETENLNLVWFFEKV